MPVAVARSLVLSVVLLHPQLATAESSPVAPSFANRSLGLAVGAMRVFGSTPVIPDVIVPMWLEGSVSLLEGVELVLRVPVALGHVRAGAATSDGAGLIVAVGAQVGARYVFLENAVRPFVSVHVGGLCLVRAGTPGDTVMIGPGLGVGLEAFVAPSVSLQLRGIGEWFTTLGGSQGLSAGAALAVSAFF
jgi:hypothetical protein